ncbi:MAG: PspC domain-containing protein [Candidatus Dormibacteraceae bacterium]
MFCHQCGKEQAAPANYCCFCGAASCSTARVVRKLSLSATDRKIAGVCGGFAAYLELDPTVMRLIWIMLALLGGWGLIGYAVAWLIMPNPEKEIAKESGAVRAEPVMNT